MREQMTAGKPEMKMLLDWAVKRSAKIDHAGERLYPRHPRGIDAGGDQEDDDDIKYSDDVEFDAESFLEKMQNLLKTEDNLPVDEEILKNEEYSSRLEKELRDTTMGRTFERGAGGGASVDGGVDDEDLGREFDGDVDIDLNLVHSLLESYSSQQGLPGPATNLLGSMGLRMPEVQKE